MTVSPEIAKVLILAPLTVVIIYYDIRYRRIPNVVVLSTIVAGFAINYSFAGLQGIISSLLGSALAFAPMFFMHVFGAMGAGDVKLFAAVGAVLGVALVPMSFVIVVLLGGLLAVYSMLRNGTVFTTLHGVLRIFVSILPGWETPRFAMAADRRHTIPYGVAITLGSLLVAVWFRR